MELQMPVGVGLLGAGTVGSGVAEALSLKAEMLHSYVGRPLKLTRVLVNELAKDRSEFVSAALISDDASAVIESDEVDIVVELIGGEEPALGYICSALRAGKHVVTANKKVMAKHGPEVVSLAAANGVTLAFEASVGGGIPIIGPLVHDLAANDITAVNAVINGTTNYMLTRMAGESLGYEEALSVAQSLGYAEPDPTDDVDGLDAAYKLAILSSIAFRGDIRDSDVFREGIRYLSPVDFKYAHELGYVVKLLATSSSIGGEVRARVHPAFLPEHNPLSKVDGVYNAVELEGDLISWAMFQGPGAGSQPTASAILGDVAAIAQRIASGVPAATHPPLTKELTVLPMADLETKYYLRVRAFDRPGVMAKITSVLGERQVSLASVIQKEVGEGDAAAEIVITTHKAKEHAVQEAVRKLEALDVVFEVASLVRIEDGTA